MSEQFSDRKIFMIACPDKELAQKIEESISERILGLTFYRATDGLETRSKIENVPPHVLILTFDLPKADSRKIVDDLIANKKYEETAVIFLAQPPDEEMFVDEIVTGRVQFLGGTVNNGDLLRTVNRALNYVSSHQHVEFHLVFLSEGDILMKEGDPGDNVYLLRSGKLEAFHQNGDVRVSLGTIDVGEFVGEMAYINGEPRSASVLATTNCELIEVPIGRLDYFLYRKPAWTKALMSTLSKRLKRLNAGKIGGAVK